MSDLKWVSERASGILIPSGDKAGMVYGIVPQWAQAAGVPENAFDFTFSRASKASRINPDGLIETIGNDIPRLQYPSCPGLLLEQAKTNLAKWSEDFSQSIWAASGVTITGGISFPSADSPSAGLFIEEDTSDGPHYVRQPSVTNTAGTYIVSFFAKAHTRNFAAIGTWGAGLPTKETYFDLANGTVGTIQHDQAGIVPLSDGWYRCWVSVTTSTSSTNWMKIATAAADGTPLYQGEVGKGIYATFAQVEQSTFPTSYIKTEAATVNRAIDNIPILDISSFMNNAGSYFIDCDFLSTNNGFLWEIRIYDNSDGNSIGLRQDVPGAFPHLSYNDGTDTFMYQPTQSKSKICFTYDATTIKASYNGTEVYNGSWGGFTPDMLSFSNSINSYILRQLILFNSPLTTQQANDLTA